MSGLARLFFVGLQLMFVFSSQAHATSEDEASRFLAFFKAATSAQEIDDPDYIWRWPRNQTVCIFGEYSNADQQKLLTTLSFLNDVTQLNLSFQEQSAVEGCSQDSLIYFQFFTKNKRARQSIWENFLYIDALKGRSTVRSISDISELGHATTSFGGKQPPYIYIASRNAGKPPSVLADRITTESIQKLLFAMLMALSDTKPLKNFDSSFVDQPGTLTDDPKEELLGAGTRRSNLSLMDTMLLIALYYREEGETGQLVSLDNRIAFIKNNYLDLKKRALAIMNRKEYQSLFPSKY